MGHEIGWNDQKKAVMSSLSRTGKVQEMPAFNQKNTITHVLQVEDTFHDAKLVQEYLRRQTRTSFRVSWVESVTEASKLLQQETIHIILLDLNVLDSTGLDTFTKIFNTAPSIPIVIMSGEDDDQLAIEAVRQGAQDYLLKGQVSQDLLIRAIHYATERKRTQEALAESEEQFRNLLETISAAALILSDKKLIYANPAIEEMTGYKVKELQELGWRQIIHPNHVPGKISERANSGASIFEEQSELHILTKGGVERWLEFTTRRIKYNKSPATLVTLFDVTVRKQEELQLKIAKQAAEQASQAKSAFLANVSHELRTPLNAIIGYTELMLDEVIDAELVNYAADLSKVQASAQHLRHMINTILDISKLEAGKVGVDVSKVDVGELMKSVKETVIHLAAKNGNTVDLAYADDVGFMLTDEFKLRRILQNILDNATKFTKNGQISFSAMREKVDSGEAVVFRISDTGIGMDVDEPLEMFKPFTQADSSATRHYGGVGLGLTISWRFCQLLNGQMSVETKKGIGTTFTLRFPAALEN
jgi:PAS domain S-box-containing protein